MVPSGGAFSPVLILGISVPVWYWIRFLVSGDCNPTKTVINKPRVRFPGVGEMPLGAGDQYCKM